ncbi:MAG: hypothetical protein H0A75_04055 [Candidatus Methanofishera endochildressiae]|uniref:Uncharacterized protein n=1 Tax=Candidatus Methanofishera endochildressiae TaxID=2738884 RepID=A0A7Z0SDP5_9GAMM|nr:hypothetical protein [Candidatus Methanofishera endochildressiae]
MKTITPRTFCIVLPLAALLRLRNSVRASFTCIPTKLFRCEPDEQSCMTIPIISSLGDVKIAINLAERKVKSYSDRQLLTYSAIDSVEEENGLIFLTGKGHGVDNAYRA